MVRRLLSSEDYSDSLNYFVASRQAGTRSSSYLISLRSPLTNSAPSAVNLAGMSNHRDSRSCSQRSPWQTQPRYCPRPRSDTLLKTSNTETQNFKVLASSTSSDSRLRKMPMMMPNPTAASAAATVITINTNNWPVTSRKKLENATNVRFTALSISSMHMNMEIMLRLIITPTTPIVNNTADSARYHGSCGVIN